MAGAAAGPCARATSDVFWPEQHPVKGSSAAAAAIDSNIFRIGIPPGKRIDDGAGRQDLVTSTARCRRPKLNIGRFSRRSCI